jgi:hypothetical protein
MGLLIKVVTFEMNGDGGLPASGGGTHTGGNAMGVTHQRRATRRYATPSLARFTLGR